MAKQKFDIADPKLAADGWKRVLWADQEMPVLRSVRARFQKEKPLKGLRFSACLHVTAETANLIRALKAGGADVVLCASNPLSTQDDVAAALVKKEAVSVFAVRGEDHKTYYSHLRSALDHRPVITMDDGADLVSMLHQEYSHLAGGMMASMEETTTGVIRLRALEADKALKIPIIAVNDAATKHLFDNRYGTGQSTIDGIIRATDVLLAGKRVVGGGLRLVRPGRGLARPRHGRQGGGHRGRPGARAGSLHGRLRRHAHEGSRQGRRPLHHPHRRHARHRQGPPEGHEGRRHHLQFGPLRHRDRPQGPHRHVDEAREERPQPRRLLHPARRQAPLPPWRRPPRQPRPPQKATPPRSWT